MLFKKQSESEIERVYIQKFVEWTIKNFLNKPGHLLDVGCREGYYADAFEQHGFTTERIDLILGTDLNKTRMRYKNKFDYIYARSLIEFLNKPIDFAKDCFSALKKGGKIFVLTPNWKTQYKWFYENYTRVSPFTLRSLRMLMEDAGFKTEYTNEHSERRWLWRYWMGAFHKKKGGKYLVYVGAKL
jgi:SAM-dependent methyltransferase